LDTQELDTTIRRSMQVFWQRGTGVSFGELVEATGQNRKTLYGYFGDKATLIGAAMGMYRREVLDPLLALLETPGGSKAYWDAYEKLTEIPGWKGCMLIRAATGESRDLPIVQTAYRAYADAFVQAMKAAYIREGEAGDPEQSAWAAFGVKVAITSMGAQGSEEPRLSHLFAVIRAANGLYETDPTSVEAAAS